MLLHPLVWSNTAIVSTLGPSQLCPHLARCHSTCSASPRPPASLGRPAAGPAHREASAKYASASAPLTLHGKRTRTVQISRCVSYQHGHGEEKEVGFYL